MIAAIGNRGWRGGRVLKFPSHPPPTFAGAKQQHGFCCYPSVVRPADRVALSGFSLFFSSPPPLLFSQIDKDKTGKKDSPPKVQEEEERQFGASGGDMHYWRGDGGEGGSTFLWWDRAPKSAKKVKAISSLLDPRTQTAKKRTQKKQKEVAETEK